MTGKMKRLMSRYLLGLCLSVFPAAIYALGLGEIKLQSALNEPLSAQIELLAATPEELRSLKAGLASRDTFTRYGIEPSGQLANLRFAVGRDSAGRDVLQVTSTEAISDPFLTLLVEVSWARGRLLREYTMLLDPPVYMPGEQGGGTPVAAPQTAPGAPSAVTPESTTTPAPAARPAPAAPAGGSSYGSSYTVRRNDTLWQIASQHTSGSPREINRMMVALYRANPEAFNRNINELRAGAILRLPAESEVGAIGAGEAATEVRRQYAEWREDRAAPPDPADSESARLRLVAPTERGDGAGASSEAAELSERVRALEQELDESRRMLELKNAELARLQQRLGETPAATAPSPEGQPSVEAQVPDEDVPPAEAQEPVAGQTDPGQTDETQPSTPVAAEEPQPSIVDWLIKNWYFAAGGLLLLGGAIIFTFLRQRGEPDFEALGRLARADDTMDDTTRGREPPHIDEDAQTSSTARLRTLKREDGFLVEESGEHEQLQVPDPGAVRKATTVPASDFLAPRPEPSGKTADDTLSSETAINLDQGDPLAEADFHMAYGLYDQAADLVRIAGERQPQRRDLKLKLLEIYFVWGNKDAFLQSANELHASADQAPPGEWDKIVIMGKQIAPEDPLFAHAARGGSSSEVDLDLQGGDNRVDLDVFEGAGSDSIDLDFGADDKSSSTEQTGEVETPDVKSSSGIDFVFDEPGAGKQDTSATTREMAASTMETPTVEMQAVADDEPDTSGSEAPTVETPALGDKASSTIKEKLDSAQFRSRGISSDQTAELAIDDLGLDVDAGSLDEAAESLDSLEETDHPRESLEETDHPSDAATMLAGLDEASRRTLEEAEARRQDADQAGDEDPDSTLAVTRVSPDEQSPTTGTWILDEDDQAATMTSPDVGAGDVTARAPSPGQGKGQGKGKPDNDATAELKAAGGGANEMDLGSFEAALASDTAKHPRRGTSPEEHFSSDVFGGSKDLTDTDIDLDVSEARRSHDQEQTQTERISAEDMDLPELEPVTMSEVGTKLDLARAYMDMGDPEGARNILDEVLQEGSATQKQEAQRLIDSLP
jgi:pilus assembly protein FimV